MFINIYFFIVLYLKLVLSINVENYWYMKVYSYYFFRVKEWKGVEGNLCKGIYGRDKFWNFVLLVKKVEKVLIKRKIYFIVEKFIYFI